MTSTSSTFTWFGLLHVAIAIGVIVVVGSVVVPMVPVWVCRLGEHFRPQYVGFGVAIAAAAGVLGMGGWFDVAAIATLVNALWIVPDLAASPRTLPAGTPVRMLVLNVHTESTSYDRVRALIVEVHPDVIALVEVDRRWLDALAPAVADYAGRLEHPRDDNFGVALYARAPIAGAIEWVEQLPIAVGDVTVGGAHLTVIAIHPIPPVSGPSAAMQTRQLAAIATRANAIAGPLAIAGDFNATPWSQPFRDLLGRTDLCDTRVGFGLQGSFPADLPITRIAIDHVLARCTIGVRDRAIAHDVGSDHFPVVLDLVIPAR